MIVIKRDGSTQEFDRSKIELAISKAFDACCPDQNKDIISKIVSDIPVWDEITIEEIQDSVVETLRDYDLDYVADAYQAYRSKQSRLREIENKINYQDEYINSSANAASSSATDANANVISKNVATLESEDRKVENRDIQRYRMKHQLKKMYPGTDLYSQYLKDLLHHILYTHDEASTSVLKQYCMAADEYPLMLDGVGNIDGVTPGPPNDMLSFSGQNTNLVFLLSSQCKGAVALGGYLVALNHYIVLEYGEDWYEKLDAVVTTPVCKIVRTVKDMIHKSFKQFVYGINQPAGNRSFQSPFTNISYFDSTYFNAMFKDFYYPDGSKPEWKAVDVLQKLFMKWFNKERTKVLLTFPVETMAMVHDGTDVIDKEYKDFCAEMYAEGHSFFTYISDSADSLASCCRLRNELSENTFSPTSGLTGIKTGSCNVITLNMNRIIQDWYRSIPSMTEAGLIPEKKNLVSDMLCDSPIWGFKDYLINILDRVYKYHIAYKTMLYDWEEKGAFASSNAGYINIKNLYSTVGLNGLNEAALFMGLEVNNNSTYIKFLQLILGTVKEQNKIHSIHDKKRPFLFNSEVVPAEGLGGKNYRWDKEDGYWVPEDRNLYNSYFYDAHDPNTSIRDKFILHGRQTYCFTDGGSALHCNLDNHLSKEQYLKLIEFAVKEGTQYFTFNVPNTKCEDCGHIVKQPLDVCPKCGSTHTTKYTRIIGYLRPLTSYGSDRYIEALKRIYSNGREEI